MARGDLPDDLVVGRWWSTSGEPCEVDVLGLRGRRTSVLGEARWQTQLLDLRDLEQLRRTVIGVPDPVDTPLSALWARAGVSDDAQRAGVRGFSLAAMF